MPKRFFVYIMTNRPDGVLYIGVTSNLPARVHQHRTGAVEGFTKRYNLHRLVWAEEHETAASAIQREKHMKKWNRAWKVKRFERDNPNWDDLFESTAAHGI